MNLREREEGASGRLGECGGVVEIKCQLNNGSVAMCRVCVGIHIQMCVRYEFRIFYFIAIGMQCVRERTLMLIRAQSETKLNLNLFVNKMHLHSNNLSFAA